jgi:hypothetical protein
MIIDESSRSVSHPQRPGSLMVTDESARSDLHCAEDFLSSYKRQCEVEMTPKRSDSTKRVRRSSIAFNASIKSREDRKDSSVGVETLWEESDVDAASDLCPCVPSGLSKQVGFTLNEFRSARTQNLSVYFYSLKNIALLPEEYLQAE